MSSCIAADASLSPAKPAWRAVYALALGVFGLIVAEFLPASLLTPMASSLGVSEGMAGQAVTATALVALVTGLLIATATRNIDRRWVLMFFSVITACATFFTVLFAPLFFKSDKLNICKIIGCVLGFCGVLCVNSGGGVTVDTLFGDFMILMSTLSAAAGNFISKGIVRDREPISVTGFQLLFGGILLLIAGFVTGGKLDFSSIKALLVLLWLAFVSAAAFAIWTALLKHHPASRICVFNLLVPVFGTLLSGIMLGESVFGIETIVSVVLICAGIFISNMQIKKRCER